MWWAPLFELLAADGALAVARLEAGDTTAGVQDLLLAGVERVAGRADLDVDLAAAGGAAGGELVPAATRDRGLVVVGVDTAAHWVVSSREMRPPGPLNRGEPEPRCRHFIEPFSVAGCSRGQRQAALPSSTSAPSVAWKRQS